jgi:G3E family GTPase
MSGRVPFSVVTGGLGSGKTTLLARLLRQPGMAGTGVVVNEFGEIALDAALIGHDDGHTIVLAGGCVCCLALGDFVAAVRNLEARAGDSLARVVIETSGLADPMPILQALAIAPDLAARYVPGSVIATIDALQGERELGRQHLAVRQIALADRIVLTKSDIAAPRAVKRLRQCVQEINPIATVIVANHGEVTPEQLFDGLEDRARPPLPQAHLHDHGAVPHAFSLTWNEPVHWHDFAPALERLVQAHGEKLLRVKGIVHVAGDLRPWVVQGVRGFLHDPVRLATWPDADRSTRIVFIADGLSETDIRAALP